MTDTVDKNTRSRMMSAIRGKDTQLEMAVRSRLFARGYRYRLHVKSLHGRPDMVFPKYATAVFVNGCFWHYHGCHRSTVPEARREWWIEKLRKNRTRDIRNLAELQGDGWRVLVIWECAVRHAGVNKEKAFDNVCDQTIEFLHSDMSLRHIEYRSDSTETRKALAS